VTNDPGPLDVLIVDDILEAAEDYARLVTAITGLVVRFTDDPSEAVNLAHQTRIKVLVIDQRLENRTPDRGTELYRQIKEIDPLTRAIMLTGQRNDAAIGHAIGLEFRDFLEKDSIRDLPTKVLGQYAKYMAELTSHDLAGQRPVVLFQSKGRWPGRRESITYRLINIEPISDDLVSRDDQWVTEASLTAGQKETVELSIAAETTVASEEEVSDRLKGDLGLSTKHLADLSVNLSRELTVRLKGATTVASRREVKISRTFELPPEPSNPDELHVVHRRIQRSPAYKMYRADLTIHCTCCRLTNAVSLELLIATGRMALRREDVLSDHQVRRYMLGSD